MNAAGRAPTIALGRRPGVTSAGHLSFCRLQVWRAGVKVRRSVATTVTRAFWARRFGVGEREGGEQAEDEHPDAEFDEGEAALGDGVRGPRTQGSGRVGRESRAMRWRWSDESFHCAAK